MLSFTNDYSEGAHPRILERFAETNMEQLPGYGCDRYTESAAKKIREACGAPEADVWFLTGGTQTNQTVIDAITPPYAGVVAASSGHVNVHEAGAIEHTGHKILTLPEHDGKVNAGELDQYCKDFYADGNYEHMVFPGTLYISHPTEYGTLYSKAELEALAEVCHRYELAFFLDGARLGYGLTAEGTDVTLEDIARLTDVFYIGGTKVGALCGEAVVFPKGNSPKHFLTLVKQHGALLAKGWLTGLQFDTLFTDGLYLDIARNANDKADQIRKALVSNGYELAYENPTNQIMVNMDTATVERLSKDVEMGFMRKVDDRHTIMRLCTSWATTQEHTDQLIALL
ncbi:MAG: beta-eliminating lyase-related protein [Bifidobacterium tibiigranuli]|jgi:threonine aldolase|uniref:threonine aldolase family protein n=1 Tax=Bifidobacterium tibiigranuli TaxID=2172043 RepID=UPI002357A36D|nr:aminotransferase class I/II-fold pyridoxal phosphate-dependent enzyme [Bifidobacterium tibiigranuli]MCH3974213.1 beta-eliminating lyase-related protein [Bifidobacterium tibiigranuli]MCH4188776.1 beta-eliminating lyase-related protein [Bifidobacterium tibiigranuli]MCH4203319.1 beta-eliminating lyase-related protein [Bifidobacterium tibiigranuli]MCH4273552.1 beta-eliminating lyase-related protein [Bifidobacterium tibiigranuli]MCI1790666.1 beta-eliminating lyase-related protein [Bifidobacteriu